MYNFKNLYKGIIDAKVSESNYLELVLIFACHCFMILFSIVILLCGLSLLLGALKLITLFVIYFIKI